MSNDSSSRRRGVWGHWLPLVVTVTVATAGLAAWAWSQRKDEDERPEQHDENIPGLDYENADYGDNPAYGSSSSRRPPKGPSDYAGDRSFDNSHLQPDAAADGGGWGARVSTALQRTPSPQQFFENAGKTVTAGVVAAGAVAGRALAAIREEDKTAYADHETWSEEADARKDRAAGPAPPSQDSGRRRRTVAVVVSADVNFDDTDGDDFLEHASVLSHIPRHNDFSQIKLFILIYAPGLKDNALEPTSNLPPPSLSSSFSNIEHHQAQTPADDRAKSPQPEAAVSPAFNAIQSQALDLVEKETMVLPFTTPSGHAHILRHLKPDVVYLQESLAGESGSIVANLQTWLRHDVILVVGAESGHGGLADSESEAERPSSEVKWWQRPERVGRGRGVVVVDGMRVNDDWQRRVQGMD